MRIARIATPGGARFARPVDGGWRGVRDPTEGDPDDTVEEWTVSEARVLAPCRPRIVIGMSHNNGSAADRELPPQAFLKSPRGLVGPGDPILVDPALGTHAVEGELGLVIARPARRLRPESALDAVLGATVVNDVTLLDQIALDDHLVQSKGADGGTPVGPWIDTSADWRAATIRMNVNGVERVTASVADLAYDPVEVLCYLTRYLTLGPGDVVLCGAPGTTVAVEPGARVAITIEGIGELVNEVHLDPDAGIAP